MDYPAAHSMDTDWYVVDRDGNVARCDSGEIGHIPETACEVHWQDLYEQLVLVRYLGALRDTAADESERILLAQVLAGDDDARAVYADYREANPRAPSVIAVRDELVAMDSLDLPEAWDGVIVFRDQAAWGRYEAAHRDALGYDLRPLDARLGVPFAVGVSNVDKWSFRGLEIDDDIALALVIERVPEPRELGFFEYQCDWSHGSYQRAAAPALPVAFTDLPPHLRELLSACRWEVSFADDDHFDADAHAVTRRYFSDDCAERNDE